MSKKSKKSQLNFSFAAQGKNPINKKTAHPLVNPATCPYCKSAKQFCLCWM